MAEGKPKQIGRYEIVEELGRGGFGLVYRAFDPTVNRSVAIKVLTQASKDTLTRFRNEAMVAGNLRHENLVTVYEYGTHENLPFIAMEYLEGEDLHHIISSRKPLSLLEKCNIMSQVAEGLYCAHKNGVVHRDVKPANIMVLRDGTVKIMDFGIARLMNDRDATRLTQQGYLIGTLLYMAPEQLAGADFDSLCDIFAYGVIFYELITGKHPFEAPDARSMMYRLTFEDPRPLKEFAPDVPEALQQIVSKIVQRDRELRYQSLKEVLFDIQPLVLDQRRERASTLLAQAQELIEKKQLEPAQTVLQESLGLDPGNQAARALREQLLKQLRQRSLQPRIESLLGSAEDHLVKRRFTDAVQAFELALKLDRENDYIQARIEHAKGLAEHARQASELLAEARREFEGRNLTAAYRTASEALRHDPENPEAAEFLKTVKSEVERRQAEQRIDEAIRKAQSLLLVPAYDEALALLTGLGPEADSPKVRRTIELVRNEKTAQERKQRLQNEMAGATDLLRDQRLEEAASRLEDLQRDYPDNKEVAHLLAYAQKELASRARALAIETAVKEAGTLAASRNYEAALTVLDRSLEKFPGETALIRILAQTMSAKGTWERQQAVQAVLARCEALRAEQRFAEAVEAVEGTLQMYSSEPALLRLLEQLEAEWNEQRRKEAVQKVREQAEALLEQKQPEKAVERLRQVLTRYPDEPVLSELLSRAEQEARERERARAVEAIARAVAQRTGARDFEGALRVVDKGLEDWKEDGYLLRLRGEVLGSRQAWERQQAINGVLAGAKQLLSDEHFLEALSTVTAALEEYAGDPQLTELQKEIDKAWEAYKRRQAILKASSDARKLISGGRLDEAVAMLEQAVREYPGERELGTLSGRAREALRARNRALAIERAIKESQELADGKQFERARRILEQALVTYVAESNLIRQLEAVENAESAWQQELAIKRLLEQTEQLARDNRFEEAIKLLASSNMKSPLLETARKDIENQQAEYLRRKSIASAASGASLLLDQGRLEEAIQLLRRATTSYPGESEWEPLLARARRDLAARKRAEDIARVEKDAGALASRNQFSEALEMLARGLETWPGEASLLKLRESVEGDRAAWERKQAFEKILREVEDLAKQRQFEKALQLAGEGLREYREAPALVELRNRVESEWLAQRRSQAIEAAAAQGRSLISAGRWNEALDLLRISCSEYAGDPALQALLSEAENGLKQKERRDRAVIDAEAMLAEGRHEDAIGSLEPVAARFPDDPEVAALLKRGREQLEARRLGEAVDKLADEALALASRSEFDRGLALVNRALKNWPGESRLLEVRGSLLAAREEWQRAEALKAAIEKVRKLGSGKRYAEAIAAAETALKEYPGDPALSDLLKEFQFRQTLANARRLIETGRPDEALEMLLSLPPGKTADPELAAVLDQARIGVRAAAIDRHAREVRSLIDAGDLDAAMARLDEGLRKWADARSLQELRHLALSRKAAWQRQQAIDTAAQECRRLEEKGQLKEAMRLVEKFLGEYPDAPPLTAIRLRLRDELAEQERRRQRSRDLKELGAIQAAAVKAQSADEISELLARAREIGRKYSSDQEVQSSAAEPIRHLSDIERAHQEVADGAFDSALGICAPYLARFPDHTLFGELKRKAELGRKGAHLEALRQSAAAEPDLAKRALILEEGLQRYPGEAAIADELRFIRKKLALADSIVEKARAAEQAGRWDEALEQWTSLLTIYDQYPELKKEIERVQRARDAARAEAIDHWARQIEQMLGSGDVSTARELLRQSLAEHQGAPRLLALESRLREAEQKKARARDLLAQAQAAREKGRFAECQACLREAFQLEEFDPAFRKLVLTKLIDHAESVVQTDWRQAETLVIEANSLEPGYQPPEAMLRNISDRKKDAAVADCLAQADEFQKKGDLQSALAELERGLQSYPDEQRLAAPRSALAGQIRQEREAVAGELRQIDESAKSAGQAAELDALRIRAAGIAAENQADREIADLAAATIRVLEHRAKELRREHLRSLVAANRKRLLMFAGAAGVLLAAVVVVPPLLRGPAKISVNITTDVAGASVEIGNEKCTTPNCTLKVGPGSYALRVAKAGYKPITREVKVTAGQPPVEMALTLEPLSQLLSVNTNFDSGQVYIDGRRAGALRDGQFTASGILPGRHTLRVTGGSAEFEAGWNSAAGSPPGLIGPITAKEVQATVVANAGGAGSIACNCGVEEIKVDGASAGKTPAASGSSASLPELKEGTRQIAIGDRSVVVDIRPDPALNVFLNLDRNVGVLTVETGEDRVKVFLNSQQYQRTTEHGKLRIPLDVGTYSIRVEKDGFQAPPTQQIMLKKGEEKPVVFALSRSPAYLEISGAVAGSSVKLDGQTIGETNSAGTFRHEVPPGQHTVQLTKDDYSPVQFSEQFTSGKTTQLERARVTMSKLTKAPPPPDPKRIEAQDWARIASSTNPDDFDTFVKNHPGAGTLAGQARARAAELRQQAQANASRQAEQAAWNKVDPNNKGQLEDYLSHFSTGQHADGARARIAELDRLAAEASAAQTLRDREQKKRADQQAVVKVLKDFEAAYNSKDIGALQKIWSGLPVATYRQQFADAKELRFQLEPVGQPSMNGDSASVTCTRRLVYRPRSGPAMTAAEPVTVTLFRSSSGWQIGSIDRH